MDYHHHQLKEECHHTTINRNSATTINRGDSLRIIAVDHPEDRRRSRLTAARGGSGSTISRYRQQQQQRRNFCSNQSIDSSSNHSSSVGSSYGSSLCSHGSGWRSMGRIMRSRLVSQDEKNDEGRYSTVRHDCPIERYYDLADKVFERFLQLPVDFRDEMAQAYLVGTRLSRFLSTILPTHEQYNSIETAHLQLKSKKQLTTVVEYLDCIALVLDQEEHERYVQNVLETTTFDGSMSSGCSRSQQSHNKSRSGSGRSKRTTRSRHRRRLDPGDDDEEQCNKGKDDDDLLTTPQTATTASPDSLSRILDTDDTLNRRPDLIPLHSNQLCGDGHEYHLEPHVLDFDELDALAENTSSTKSGQRSLHPDSSQEQSQDQHHQQRYHSEAHEGVNPYKQVAASQGKARNQQQHENQDLARDFEELDLLIEESVSKNGYEMPYDQSSEPQQQLRQQGATKLSRVASCSSASYPDDERECNDCTLVKSSNCPRQSFPTLNAELSLFEPPARCGTSSSPSANGAKSNTSNNPELANGTLVTKTTRRRAGDVQPVEARQVSISSNKETTKTTSLNYPTNESRAFDNSNTRGCSSMLTIWSERNAPDPRTGVNAEGSITVVPAGRSILQAGNDAALVHSNVHTSKIGRNSTETSSRANVESAVAGMYDQMLWEATVASLLYEKQDPSTEGVVRNDTYDGQQTDVERRSKAYKMTESSIPNNGVMARRARHGVGPGSGDGQSHRTAVKPEQPLQTTNSIRGGHRHDCDVEDSSPKFVAASPSTFKGGGQVGVLSRNRNSANWRGGCRTKSNVNSSIDNRKCRAMPRTFLRDRRTDVVRRKEGNGDGDGINDECDRSSHNNHGRSLKPFKNCVRYLLE